MGIILEGLCVNELNDLKEFEDVGFIMNMVCE